MPLLGLLLNVLVLEFNNKWILQYGRCTFVHRSQQSHTFPITFNKIFSLVGGSISGTNQTAANSNNNAFTAVTVKGFNTQQAEGTYSGSYIATGC